MGPFPSGRFCILTPNVKLLEIFILKNYCIQDQRGRNGLLPTTTGNPPVLALYKRAAEELGYSYGDSNGPQREGCAFRLLRMCPGTLTIKLWLGFSPLDFNQSGGRAATTCGLLVRRKTKRLKVLTYADVTKIQFNSVEKLATGVEYTRHENKFAASARKEVILCAGVFRTPLLLFKSGIGPAKMLSAAQVWKLWILISKSSE